MKKLLLISLLSLPAYAHSPAQVIRVLDGDTVEVKASIWPGQEVVAKIRIEGVDTPEIRTKKLCEKELGLKAKTFTVNFLQGDIQVRVDKHGSFGGRVIGDIYVNGKSLKDALIESGHGKPYKRPKVPWC